MHVIVLRTREGTRELGRDKGATREGTRGGTRDKGQGK